MDWTNTVKDPKMKDLLKVAQNVAPRKATVLIYGESGVGKELLSRYIHECSQRPSGKFVAVNCAAVPENLLESELFGYEKGAFTGASQAKPGKFELADGGTFLLDEVSEMPLLLQGKLLRVLQESEVERLGATGSKIVDVRVICTSNKDLAKMVSEGTFRKDLYYRLNVIPLEIPPLRERKKDLVALVKTFLASISESNDMVPVKISDAGMRKILDWNWPGNIRELQNVLERSMFLAGSDELSAHDIRIENFKPQSLQENTAQWIRPGLTIHEAERRLILKTLEKTEQNRTRAAEILGISIRTLRNKLNEYKESQGGLL